MQMLYFRFENEDRSKGENLFQIFIQKNKQQKHDSKRNQIKRFNAKN